MNQTAQYQNSYHDVPWNVISPVNNPSPTCDLSSSIYSDQVQHQSSPSSFKKIPDPIKPFIKPLPPKLLPAPIADVKPKSGKKTAKSGPKQPK